MSEVVDPYVILQRIEQMEKELEELRITVLKMVAENLPEEEVDEETLKALEKDLRDMMEGRVKTLSGDEFIELLSKKLGTNAFCMPCFLAPNGRRTRFYSSSQRRREAGNPRA